MFSFFYCVCRLVHSSMTRRIVNDYWFICKVFFDVFSNCSDAGSFWTQRDFRDKQLIRNLTQEEVCRNPRKSSTTSCYGKREPRHSISRRVGRVCSSHSLLRHGWLDCPCQPEGEFRKWCKSAGFEWMAKQIGRCTC